MTLISRILGFIRDIVLARVFGAGPMFDAFVVAFRIPNLMRRLFAEGSFSLAFVPVLTEYKEKRSPEELCGLIDNIAGTLLSALLVVTGLGILFAPGIVHLFAPGFAGDPQTFDAAAKMLRITFPFLLFVSLVAMCGGILNTFGRFAIPALTPVLLNVAMITAAVAVAPLMTRPVEALAWAVLVAGAVQLLVQVPALGRLGLLPRPRWGWKDSAVRRVLKLMVPTLLGASAAQINILIDTVIASFLVAGSMSWLYYADRLMEFPLGVFGIALATVILPNLSSRYAVADKAGFAKSLNWALLWSMIIGLPAAVGLGTMAKPIVLTLFAYGEFTVADADMSALALMAYALGLPAFMMIKVLAPAFFARQDTRTPVKAALSAMALNLLLNLTFVGLFLYFDQPGAHAGLAAASSLAAYWNAGFLWRRLRASGYYEGPMPWKKDWLRAAVSAAVMGGVAFVYAANHDWANAPVGQRILDLSVGITAAAGTYLVMLLVQGLRPAHLRVRPD